MRFAEACKAAELIGFQLMKIKGSHHIFKRPGEMDILNFQKTKNGSIPSYQADQLIEKITRYRELQ